MNVLFTVNTYYPLKDGVQTVTGYLAEGLVRKGHNVTVVTTKNGNIDEEIYNGVRILRVDLYTRHTIYYGEKERYKKLIVELANKCDVMINVCTQNPMTDLIFTLLSGLKCKKILYMHGMYDSKWYKETFKSISDVSHKIWNNARWGVYYRNSARYFKMYDEIIQLNENDDAYTFFEKKYGIKSCVIGNAADDNFFLDRKKLGEKYFLYVANYMDGKNQKMVLKAFLEAEISNEYKMIFIGSTPNQYYTELIMDYERCLSNKEKKVDFLFDVPKNEIPSYVYNAYLYLMGSKSEKFPMSIVESMACGVPYISTNVGCLEQFPGGILVNDVKEMAQALKRLCENEVERNQLSKEGKEYAINNFRVEDKINQLDSIIMN